MLKHACLWLSLIRHKTHLVRKTSDSGLNKLVVLLETQLEIIFSVPGLVAATPTPTTPPSLNVVFTNGNERMPLTPPLMYR